MCTCMISEESIVSIKIHCFSLKRSLCQTCQDENINTYKGLIGIAPSGAVVFVSDSLKSMVGQR